MTFTSADLATLFDRSRKLHVGFDDQFNRMWATHNAAQGTLTNNYPPYNIIRDGENYYVEIAVAGFREEDLDIEVKDSHLTIQGKINNQTPEESPNFIHRGIAAREFTRSFVISDDVVVRGANLANGMLTIHLEHIIPEEKKPRKIEIGLGKNILTKGNTKKPELLSEDSSNNG